MSALGQKRSVRGDIRFELEADVRARLHHYQAERYTARPA